jgi:hypothetical protein
MLFGSRQTFAIEAIVEPDLRIPSAVWGRMQVWCQGDSIGDFNERHCALYSSYMGFKSLQRSLSSLWLQEFEDLSDTAMWNHFDGLLYGYHGDVELKDERTSEQVRSDSARYRRFDFLTNWGEQFDRGGKSFIVCTPDGSVRIYNRSLPGSIRREASLPDVLFAIEHFIQWFDSEFERLQGVRNA